MEQISQKHSTTVFFFNNNTHTHTICYKSEMTGIFERVVFSTTSTRPRHTYNRSTSTREPQQSSQQHGHTSSTCHKTFMITPRQLVFGRDVLIQKHIKIKIPLRIYNTFMNINNWCQRILAAQARVNFLHPVRMLVNIQLLQKMLMVLSASNVTWSPLLIAV